MPYLALFPGLSEALAFESEVLSIGRDLLPPAAQAVLDDADPTPEYWAFLVSQVAATKTYRIDHADDRASEYVDTYEDAIAKVREIYGSAVEIGHSGDIADGGKRTGCWASAEDAENDDGRRACCEIREEVRS